MIDDVWLAVGAVSEFCVQVLQMSSDLSSDAPYKEHADPLWLHDGRCQVTVVKKYPPPQKKKCHISRSYDIERWQDAVNTSTYKIY